jgi:micrococcal nuclease
MRHAPVLRVLSALLLALTAVAAWPAAQPVEAQVGEQCFPQTGFCIVGPFRGYWEANGGLPVFGYPITPTRPEVNRDLGRSVPTQWFERNRFELHGGDVLLGRLGDDRLRQRGVTWQAQPKATPQAGCDYFAETGRNVCDQGAGLGFKSYWNGKGGLAFFGFPLTEATEETNPSGDRVLTQWFERARFEWHAGNPDQFKVLLGLLGTETLTAPPLPIAAPVGQAAPVTRVVDGDTIHVTLDGRDQAVRLTGVNTPETVAPNQPVECYGREASDFTKAHLTGKTVSLEKDVSETDRFGRLLRYAWLDGALFNETLVREGYAQVSTFPPDVKYVERFLAAQRAAQAERKGLWGACPAAQPPPPAPPPPAPPAPTPAPQPRTCDASYPTVCIPPPPPDLDCGDIPHKRFKVLPPDPHRFDADKDGIGCET